MPHPLPGTPARALRLLRAAGSLAALAVLLDGVPWILAAAGTLPRGVPSGPDMADALMSRDDGGNVLFTVLTVLARALWAWFALGVLAEVPRRLRRRPARRRRALGAPQRLAGFLLGDLLVLPAGTAVAAPAPAVAATAPLQPATTDDDSGGGQHTAIPRADTDAPGETNGRGASAGPVHVVGETGETVWDLAVEYLGSGLRAEEIRTLNPGLPQTALLPPGQEVRLPADAGTTTAVAPPRLPAQPGRDRVQLAASEQPPGENSGRAGGKERTHTVTAGESLSSIAQDETGDAANWPRLYEASKDRTQPAGTPSLKDPDVIFPGQKITIPAGTSTPPNPSHERGSQREESLTPDTDRHDQQDTQQDSRNDNDAPPKDKPSAPATPGPHESRPA